MSDFLEFLEKRSDDMLELGVQHILIVTVAVLLSTVVGVLVGVISSRTRWAREMAQAVSGAIFTIPTFALLVLLIGPFGLGPAPVIVALALYGLMPIIRNTIVGLTEVDPATTESAAGMGMTKRQQLLRIELPLAWPVILSGIRLTVLLMIGAATIGFIVLGPGYGEFIFTGLYRIGTPVALNLVLAGTLGVIVVAVLFELAFALLRIITVPKGIR
ncbi:ABC transporter permease [Microbacterium soli]|uniref:ABC transporter permease n=1 Tax=Microbacterium soli TaxID=446075 RepID=A0ABP7N7J9_9MICO